MARIIEVTVAPDGSTKIATHGYTGQDCLAASRFLEEALGTVAAERKTAEFYAEASVEQSVQQ